MEVVQYVMMDILLKHPVRVTVARVLVLLKIVIIVFGLHMMKGR
jgi:hypothetical protein